MVANLDELVHTVESTKSLVLNYPADSSVVFKYAMGRAGNFLDRLCTELNNAESLDGVYNTISKFHTHMGSRLTILNGVNNKAELSEFMKSTHAQIGDALVELSESLDDENAFYGVVDRHVSLIGENMKAYRNATHKEFMCNIGDALTCDSLEADDHARQWEAVERIANILEKLQR
jgi:hypothetical protein